MCQADCFRRIVHRLGTQFQEWKLAFADSLSRNPRIRTIKVAASFYLTERELVKEIADAKKALGLPEACKVVSCYEAGRQDFGSPVFERPQYPELHS